MSAFVRPTLGELVSRVQADFVSRLDLVGAVLRRSLVYVFARVVAGAAHLLHGHLEFLGRQLFPDESEEEFLVRQAALFGLARLEPTFTNAEVTFTGVDGSVIPAGTLLVNALGYEYETDFGVGISAGAGLTSVTAKLPGAASDLVTAAPLTMQSPISGVNATATVGTVTTRGADAEPLEAFRVRLLERLAEPPHGGTAADYVAWAKEVPGVTRVWVSPLELGAGTVVIRFARDGDASPAPDAGEIAAVQAKIDVEKPVHATVTVAAVVDTPVNFTLAVVPNTIEVKDAVTAELRDLLVRQGQPNGTLLLSAVRTAIGSTVGLTDYTLTVPSGNLTFAANELPRLGTITWV